MIDPTGSDPTLMLVLGLCIGIWAPDEITNDCVKQLAGTIVMTITGKEPAEAADSGSQIPVEDADDDQKDA